MLRRAVVHISEFILLQFRHHRPPAVFLCPESAAANGSETQHSAARKTAILALWTIRLNSDLPFSEHLRNHRKMRKRHASDKVVLCHRPARIRAMLSEIHQRGIDLQGRCRYRAG